METYENMDHLKQNYLSRNFVKDTCTYTSGQKFFIKKMNIGFDKNRAICHLLEITLKGIPGSGGGWTIFLFLAMIHVWEVNDILYLRL